MQCTAILQAYNYNVTCLDVYRHAQACAGREGSLYCINLLTERPSTSVACAKNGASSHTVAHAYGNGIVPPESTPSAIISMLSTMWFGVMEPTGVNIPSVSLESTLILCAPGSLTYTFVRSADTARPFAPT